MEKVDPRILAEIWEIVCRRAENPTPDSYTSRLLTDKKGIDKILEKVGEEATEFILAVKNGEDKRTVEEAADLLYHILVALRGANIGFADVIEELERRRT